MITKNEHKAQNLKTFLCKSQTYYGHEKDFKKFSILKNCSTTASTVPSFISNTMGKIWQFFSLIHFGFIWAFIHTHMYKGKNVFDIAIQNNTINIYCIIFQAYFNNTNIFLFSCIISTRHFHMDFLMFLNCHLNLLLLFLKLMFT